MRPHSFLFWRFFRRIRSSPVAWFTAATALSQVFPLVSAPILTRLYSPAAFGSYAIYFALSTILGVFALMSLQNAIILEETDGDALAAVLASLVPPLVFSVALFIALMLARPLLTIDFLAGLEDLLLILPVTVLLAAIYQVGYTWLLRQGRYRELAANKITLAASTMLIQIGVGILRLETVGFILANLAGYLLAVLIVLRIVLREAFAGQVLPSFQEIIGVLRKHRALAWFTTPASLINSACSYLPDFFVARFFGASVLGYYSLGMRMVSAPLGFISSTVQDVFRQQSAREWSDTGSCMRSFNKYLAIMTVISFLVLAPFIWLMPEVFRLVFGQNWLISGIYVQCLSVLLIIRFISSPLSYVWIVAGKHLFNMLWQIGLLIITAASFLLPAFIQEPLLPEMQFRVYGAALGAWYALALFLSYRWSRAK